MDTAHNPFEYRITPKNNWELLWWALIDSNRVEEYEYSLNLSEKEKRIHFLKIYCLYVIPITIIGGLLLYILCCALVSIIDLPTLFPKWGWEKVITKEWEHLHTIQDRFSFLFYLNIKILLLIDVIYLTFGLLFGFAGGLVLGLFLGLFLGLILGLILGLDSGLAVGLDSSLAVGLAVGLVGGLAVGLAVGLGLYLVAGLGASLVLGLVGGLRLGLGVGLRLGLGLGLGVGLAVGLIWFFYLLKNYQFTLSHNVLIRFGNIDISLLAENKFIRLSQENPSLALQFTNFLFLHRPKNHNLAALLSHTATATLWKQAAIKLAEKPLDFPILPKVKEVFLPPESWKTQLAKTKSAYITAVLQTQITLKKELFECFVAELKKLHQLMKIPQQKSFWDKISMTRNKDWYRYYAEAIGEWLRVAEQKLEDIQTEAALRESISANRYRSGEALKMECDIPVFVDRRDLREMLSQKLLATNFSVLFLQGQRRVGKTSLLKFMPRILGNRFLVVFLDLQGNLTDLSDFLIKLRTSFNQSLNLVEKKAWEIPAQPSQALKDLYAYCLQHINPNNQRIIFALDEYEELHKHLQKDSEIGAEFLATLRHLCQNETGIRWMFVGLKFFTELQSPNWNEYLVSAVQIQVSYLNQAEAEKLIHVSNLDFAEGIVEAIFEMTQGHPALIQKICYGIVNIANQRGKRYVSQEVLDKALQEMIYIPANGVTDVFWTQNCQDALDHELVWIILDGKPIPQDYRRRLRRLMNYRFIVEKEGKYSFQVPIFEKWIREFQELGK